MWRFVIHNALFCGAVGYALLRGGTSERWAALAFTAARIATVIAISSTRQARYRYIEIGVMIIDAVLFALLMALALVSMRRWPMWSAPLAGVELFGHLVVLSLPGVLPNTYGDVVQLAVYPQLFILLLATWRCRLYETGHWSRDRLLPARRPDA